MKVRVFLFDADMMRRSLIRQTLKNKGFDVWAFAHVEELSASMIFGQQQPCKNYVVCYAESAGEQSSVPIKSINRLGLPLSQIAIVVKRTIFSAAKYRGVTLLSPDSGVEAILEWLENRPGAKLSDAKGPKRGAGVVKVLSQN